MAVKELDHKVRRYIGDTLDTKPTAASHNTTSGSTYYDRETGIMYITYDGTNWVEKDTVVRLETSPTINIGDVGLIDTAGADALGVVTASPTANTLLARLKDLLTGIVLSTGSAAIGKLAANSGVDIGDVDVKSTTIAKTIETELLAITAVAADAQQKSSELALTNMKEVTILIDHGRTATTAFVAAGTEYRVEASQKATGNDTWRTIASVEAIITAAAEITADGAEAAAQTLIEVGATNAAVGNIVFWENATIGNSEWMKVVAIAGSGEGDNTFTIQDGLTNAQAAAKKIYTQGQHFPLTLDVSAFTRLRVVVNNNNGTTNVAIKSRVAAITQV